MPSGLPQYTVRAPEIVLLKAQYIAKANGRSLCEEIRIWLKAFIESYEKENGTIDKATLTEYFPDKHL